MRDTKTPREQLELLRERYIADPSDTAFADFERGCITLGFAAAQGGIVDERAFEGVRYFDTVAEFLQELEPLPPAPAAVTEKGEA